ncbi:MAG: hypothetical protein GWM87_06850 [Xanthomonadales bacterium]|nr:hypothetical protein [Xanthomonadales bacterium]NIX12683.1 hypothetical protein [Xanthomonadales bacterium]
MRLQKAVAPWREAREAALSLRTRLLDVTGSLVLVLIILVLITQSGVGLKA